MPIPERIILTGMPGTGKSTVARVIATRLGWDWVDTDAVIEQKAGTTIAAIFARDGEPAFRAMEAEALREALTTDRRVVATGGGAVLLEENRRAMAEAGFVVCLQASAEQVEDRTAPRGRRRIRPLLAAPGDASRLKAERAALYDRADWTIHTGALTADAVADEAVHAYQAYGEGIFAETGRIESLASTPANAPIPLDIRDAVAVVRATGGAYPVYVKWGALRDLPTVLDRVGVKGALHVVIDADVHGLHGSALAATLAGRPVTWHPFEGGEASKSLDTAAGLFDEFVTARAERRDAVLAVGGGVAGDLGGFVAATYLRGLPLVQIPTSLLAMVDASIGGKVAVNHREGKNLIGAFHQPRAVVADLSLLQTLPPRELTSGWAEVLKHALIADADLLAEVEDGAGKLLALDPDAMTALVGRSVAIKAAVVSADERESGPRMLLNYGHTIGHGIEAATAYGSYLHGEAVSIGMTAAVRLSQWMGLVDEATVRRQDALLERFGLPLRASGVDRAAVERGMSLDKKVAAGRIRWVLLAEAGNAIVRDDVPAELVQHALDEVLQ